MWKKSKHSILCTLSFCNKSDIHDDNIMWLAWHYTVPCVSGPALSDPLIAMRKGNDNRPIVAYRSTLVFIAHIFYQSVLDSNEYNNMFIRDSDQNKYLFTCAINVNGPKPSCIIAIIFLILRNITDRIKQNKATTDVLRCAPTRTFQFIFRAIRRNRRTKH